MADISALMPLLRELNDLKRIRVATRTGSIAERLFRRSWSRLVAGEPLETVALDETARAVVAARLAGIDAEVLADGGLNANEQSEVMQRAFSVFAHVLPDEFAARLREPLASQCSGSLTIRPQSNQNTGNFEFDRVGGKSAMDATADGARLSGARLDSAIPAFVEQLARQPRAGATRPGMARVVLEPTENHAEHCGIVAVNCVLAASVYGADVGEVFLTGLSHHLHNAYLPDAGDAGDAMLGRHHEVLMRTFRERALAQLPPLLGAQARASLDNVYRSDTPASKAFQAADSLDRVLEMEWHARSAQFTLSVALEQMDIIHPGPVQAFQLEVMRQAGLM